MQANPGLPSPQEHLYVGFPIPKRHLVPVSHKWSCALQGRPFWRHGGCHVCRECREECVCCNLSFSRKRQRLGSKLRDAQAQGCTSSCPLGVSWLLLHSARGMILSLKVLKAKLAPPQNAGNLDSALCHDACMSQHVIYIYTPIPIHIHPHVSNFCQVVLLMLYVSPCCFLHVSGCVK